MGKLDRFHARWPEYAARPGRARPYYFRKWLAATEKAEGEEAERVLAEARQAQLTRRWWRPLLAAIVIIWVVAIVRMS